MTGVPEEMVKTKVGCVILPSNTLLRGTVKTWTEKLNVGYIGLQDILHIIVVKIREMGLCPYNTKKC